MAKRQETNLRTAKSKHEGIVEMAPYAFTFTAAAPTPENIGNEKLVDESTRLSSQTAGAPPAETPKTKNPFAASVDDDTEMGDNNHPPKSRATNGNTHQAEATARLMVQEVA